MKRIFFYFLFLVFASSVVAQIGPGYLGKRFMLGYGFHFSPAILGSNGSEGSIIGRGPHSLGGDPAFNSTHDGFLEFAFKNRTSVGLSCRYYNSTFDNSTSVYGYTFTPNGQQYILSGEPGGFYQIKGLNYALYFKFYNKRYVAPWGRYFLLGPVVNTYRSFYDPGIMKLETTDGSGGAKIRIDNFGAQGELYARGDLLFGWGRNRMIGNRVTIDYGVNFQLVALGFILWDAIGESPFDIFSEVQTTNYNYIEKTSKRRVREVNKLNVFVKVGVLLF